MRTTFFLTPRQLECRSNRWSRPSISVGLAFLLALLALISSRQSSSSITSTSPSQQLLGAEAGVHPITSAIPSPEADQVPPGLTSSDWSGIKDEYERHRYAAFPIEGGQQARNYAQQWLTRFDGRGFTVEPEGAGWQWGLELQRYGFVGRERRLQGKAQVRTETERVTYAWSDELDEWFVNDRRGLEHGFTLKQRPEHREGDASPLELRLAVRGGLKARVVANGRAVRFAAANGSIAVNYSGLKVWDADGKEVAARFSAEGDELSLSVEESAARYPLTIDPIVQQAYLKASNTGNFDVFGSSVAISGQTVVVGAVGESSNATGVNGDQSDNSAINSGAAYVFVRNGNTWTQQAYLKASNTGAGDQFGTTVAISGDTIVIGAPTEDSDATGVDGDQSNDLAINAGAAYVFVRSGTTWSQQAYLKASNTGAGDQFGISVAISGDTVVIGAQSEDSNTTGVNGNQSDNSAGDSGAAYVFVRNGTTWSQQSYLKASNTGAGDQFGFSVAISGGTIVVGAVGEDSSATGVDSDQSNNSAGDSGAAYVFVRSGSMWGQQSYLKASNTGAGDQFGSSVAISGETIVVGALGEDSNARGVNGNQSNNSTNFAGAAYVFVRTGSTWSQEAYLKASNTDLASQFGHSIAISGEMIVIGAPGESSNATGIDGNQSDTSAIDAGAAYVFVKSEGTWSQQSYLKASNTGERDRFGYSVAISGGTIVVGARDEDSNATGVNGVQSNDSATDSGAVYVFALPCNYSIFPTTRSFSAAGGIGTFSVTADAGCTWVAVSNNSWIQVTDGASGNGGGTVTFQVEANTGFARSGTITIAGTPVTVSQDGAVVIQTKAGIFRSGFFWLQDVNGDKQFNSPPDRGFAFGGVPGDLPITGDWNGDGRSKVGIYRPSNALFILDYDGDGQFTGADKVYDLGLGTVAGDVPVVGDWNGDGADKVGLFRQGFFWILDYDGNGSFNEGVDKTYAFGGVSGDVPVVGDWDGSGTSKIGLFRAGFFWILDVNGDGALNDVNEMGGDQAFAYGGTSGDVPVVGDWNGDGRDKVGVFRSGFFWVLDANGNRQFDGTGAGQDYAFAFGGIAGDKPVVGKW